MKTVKPISLSLALLSTPVTYAELIAIDEPTLSNITAQTGITITSDISDIDMTYEDNDGTAGFTNPGYLHLENISINGDITLDVGNNGTDSALLIGFSGQDMSIDLGLSNDGQLGLTNSETLGTLRVVISSGSLQIKAH